MAMFLAKKLYPLNTAENTFLQLITLILPFLTFQSHIQCLMFLFCNKIVIKKSLIGTSNRNRNTNDL